MINLYKNKTQIIEGHYNELKSLFGINDDKSEIVANLRKVICEDCKLRKENYCDSNRWIHPETKEIRHEPEEGYIRGCGCRLSAKQRAHNAKCPVGFWNETMI